MIRYKLILKKIWKCIAMYWLAFIAGVAFTITATTIYVILNY